MTGNYPWETSICLYCGQPIYSDSGGLWVHKESELSHSSFPFNHYAFSINTAPLNGPLTKPHFHFYPGQILPVYEPKSIEMVETVIKYQTYPQSEEKPDKPKVGKVEKVVEPTGRKFRTEE